MPRIGRALPQNVSKPVACDLQGYEGVEFTYIISLTKRQIDAAEKAGPYETAALLVNEATAWPFEVEPPTHGNPASFEEALPLDLATWTITTGYQRAVRSAISPN